MTASDRLTKKLIDGLSYEAEEGMKDIRWDADMPGFGVRIYPSGKKSFVLSYRSKGKKHLFTVGQYGKVTLEQARDIAKKRFGEIADDKNPLLTRKASKKKHEWTVKRAFNDFLNKYAKERNKHWKESQRIFEKDVLPSYGSYPIDEITKDNIIRILDKVKGRDAGVMANRTLAHIRKFFNWCVERNLIPFSPAYKVAAPAQNPTRNRVLTDTELKEIWQATLELKYPFGPLARFLILTGQRRGEAASMRWQDYDEEKKLWIIPREFTKSDREHQVPLSDMAIEVLKSAKKLGDYVFTSAGERPFENFSRDKEDLDDLLKASRTKSKQPKMPAWRIHDFRRTAASGMARLKVQPHVVEKILNHTSGIISGVAAVYNRHQYADEMREALDKWAEHVQKIITDEKHKNAERTSN